MSRPEYVPTPDRQREARILARQGFSIPLIAEVFSLDAKTVRKHFAEAIEAGLQDRQKQALVQALNEIHRHGRAHGRQRGLGDHGLRSRSARPMLEETHHAA